MIGVALLPTLTTARLTLRPWRPDDVDAAFDIYSRWEVARFLGSSPRPLQKRTQAVAAVERWGSLPGPLHGVWAVVPHGAVEPVGSVLAKLLPLSGSGADSDRTEIGWHLHPDAWGHGYATEAGNELLAHAWRHGLDRVYAVTYPENTASRAVCRRLGMAALGPTGDYYGITCELFRATAPEPLA